jgi:sec-independent protein translocase protein TatA
MSRAGCFMNGLFPLGFFGGSLGPGEVILILLVALLLFGAKNLPRIARNLGRSLEDFRRAARDVRHEIMHAEDEAAPPPPPKPLDEPRKDSGDRTA